MDDSTPLISLDNSVEINDYTQSANTLFHFMTKQEYLRAALSRKALVPRYCRESIDYLNLTVAGITYNEIAVLTKCFCDIPLHRVATNFDFDIADESKKTFKNLKLSSNSVGNSHPSYYGEYALAFSKSWCERKNLQPIHYLNSLSAYSRSFTQMFNNMASKEDMPDEYSDDILLRLALIKPLRGKMKRVIGNEELTFIKNFHDEHEWRYIPDKSKIDSANVKSSSTYQPVIADAFTLGVEFSRESHLLKLSEDLEKEELREIWLDFSYQDIRYIIVRSIHDRLELIKHILALPDSNFDTNSDVIMARHLLISKILVFEEIKKDW